MSQISVDRVSKQKRGNSILAETSFDIDRGLVVVEGANGAGKSTLLRRCVGLSRGAGRVTFAGREYCQLRHPRKAVGFSLGGQYLPRHEKVQRLLATHAYLGGVAPRRVTAVIGDLGLHECKRERIGSLSLGYRQRVSLALSVIGDAQILLLDEPELGLDTRGRAWLDELMEDYQATGRTVVIATHHQSELRVIPDYLVRLRREASSTFHPVAGLDRYTVHLTAGSFASIEMLRSARPRWTWLAREGTPSALVSGCQAIDVMRAAVEFNVQLEEVRAATWRDSLQ
jgi:ABC-2 type transport system ATP-binding protein